MKSGRFLLSLLLVFYLLIGGLLVQQKTGTKPFIPPLSPQTNQSLEQLEQEFSSRFKLPMFILEEGKEAYLPVLSFALQLGRSISEKLKASPQTPLVFGAFCTGLLLWIGGYWVLRLTASKTAVLVYGVLLLSFPLTLYYHLVFSYPLLAGLWLLAGMHFLALYAQEPLHRLGSLVLAAHCFAFLLLTNPNVHPVVFAVNFALFVFLQNRKYGHQHLGFFVLTQGLILFGFLAYAGQQVSFGFVKIEQSIPFSWLLFRLDYAFGLVVVAGGLGLVVHLLLGDSQQKRLVIFTLFFLGLVSLCYWLFSIPQSGRSQYLLVPLLSLLAAVGFHLLFKKSWVNLLLIALLLGMSASKGEIFNIFIKLDQEIAQAGPAKITFAKLPELPSLFSQAQKRSIALPKGPPIWVSDGMDFPNGNLTSFELPVGSLGQCVQACNDKEECQGLTYEIEIVGGGSRCNLKKTLNRSSHNPCCISWSKEQIYVDLINEFKKTNPSAGQKEISEALQKQGITADKLDELFGKYRQKWSNKNNVLILQDDPQSTWLQSLLFPYKPTLSEDQDILNSIDFFEHGSLVLPLQENKGSFLPDAREGNRLIVEMLRLQNGKITGLETARYVDSPYIPIPVATQSRYINNFPRQILKLDIAPGTVENTAKLVLEYLARFKPRFVEQAQSSEEAASRETSQKRYREDIEIKLKDIILKNAKTPEKIVGDWGQVSQKQSLFPIHGIDFSDGSILSFETPQGQFESCFRRCEQEKGCVGVTYETEIAPETARCTLKKEILATNPNPCCISGVRFAKVIEKISENPIEILMQKKFDSFEEIKNLTHESSWLADWYFAKNQPVIYYLTEKIGPATAEDFLQRPFGPVRLMPVDQKGLAQLLKKPSLDTVVVVSIQKRGIEYTFSPEFFTHYKKFIQRDPSKKEKLDRMNRYRGYVFSSKEEAMNLLAGQHRSYLTPDQSEQLVQSMKLVSCGSGDNPCQVQVQEPYGQYDFSEQSLAKLQKQGLNPEVARELSQLQEQSFYSSHAVLQALQGKLSQEQILESLPLLYNQAYSFEKRLTGKLTKPPKKLKITPYLNLVELDLGKSAKISRGEQEISIQLYQW